MTSILLEGQLELALDAEHEEDAPRLPAYVPAARIAPFIRRWLAEGRTLGDLSERARVSEATLGAILRGQRELTRFRAADAIICGVGDPLAWHRRTEDGGLGDLYDSPLVVPEKDAA